MPPFDCPPGHGLETVVGDHIIALFHVEGMFYALEGVCPHQGGPLGMGELEGRVVTCPWHGWQFDVSSGHGQLSPSVVQRSFPCKVENGQVYVDLSPGGGGGSK